MGEPFAAPSYSSTCRPSAADQSRPHPSGCTLYFPFRGPNIGTHHSLARARHREYTPVMSVGVLNDLTLFIRGNYRFRKHFFHLYCLPRKTPFGRCKVYRAGLGPGARRDRKGRKWAVLGGAETRSVERPDQPQRQYRLSSPDFAPQGLEQANGATSAPSVSPRVRRHLIATASSLISLTDSLWVSWALRWTCRLGPRLGFRCG